MYTGSKSLRDRLTETVEIEKLMGKSPSRAKPTSEKCSALQKHGYWTASPEENARGGVHVPQNRYPHESPPVSCRRRSRIFVSADST